MSKTAYLNVCLDVLQTPRPPEISPLSVSAYKTQNKRHMCIPITFPMDISLRIFFCLKQGIRISKFTSVLYHLNKEVFVDCCQKLANICKYSFILNCCKNVILF